MDDYTLQALRFCFQRILVPCVVVIGIIGNSISVIVLTRRRMRCSTNIYLTALAVADIVFLLFNFILSLQHYPNIHNPKYKIYWSTFGLSHWFCDASGYTSIYLTVSFTIERYIAVCHPIRGQVLCTESRAKKVIAGVIILCFLLTVSTAFEYRLEEKINYSNLTTNKQCEQLSVSSSSSSSAEMSVAKNITTTATAGLLMMDSNDDEEEDYSNNGSDVKLLFSNDTSSSISSSLSTNNINMITTTAILITTTSTTTVKPQIPQKSTTTTPPQSLLNNDYAEIWANDNSLFPFRDEIINNNINNNNDDNNENGFYSATSTEFNGNSSNSNNQSSMVMMILNNNNSCYPIYEIFATESDLGRNESYKNFFYFFTSIFGTLVPLVLLATFNCFLVAAVHRSYKVRHRMTNTRQTDASTAQENKVTVTLIAVVVLFLVCQTPGAIQLIYTMELTEYSNMVLALNNLCNFLITLNAACNFLLYCALSDKYRKTVKDLLFGHHRRRQRRQNTITSRLFSRYGSSSHTSGTSLSNYNTNNNRNENFGENNTHSSSVRSRSKTRFTISPTEYASFQAEMAIQHEKAQQLAACDYITDTNCTPPMQMHLLSPSPKQQHHHYNQQEQPQQQQQQSFLCKSPSDTSLTRARSLIFPAQTKHSPDCKDNPNIF